MKPQSKAFSHSDTATTSSSAPTTVMESQAKDISSEEDLPDYLVRYYRWAYLWRFAVWFFDHQPIINMILFGNYRRIMDCTTQLIEPEKAGTMLQIAAVYGELTQNLAQQVDDLHVIDIAPVQLEKLEGKLNRTQTQAQLARMNAEALEYEDNSFDTSLMFLLLHEMPPEARRNSLREALRVLRPGGRFVLAEYGEIRQNHFIHRFPPLRWTLTFSEPFLDGFWKEDLVEVVYRCGEEVGKEVVLIEQKDIFGGFYRVLAFEVR